MDIVGSFTDLLQVFVDRTVHSYASIRETGRRFLLRRFTPNAQSRSSKMRRIFGRAHSIICSEVAFPLTVWAATNLLKMMQLRQAKLGRGE